MNTYEIETWILKYGFGFEDIEWLKDYVETIDQSAIIFKDSIVELSEEKLDVIRRYA